MYVCIHARDHMCASVWRSEVNSGHLRQPLTTLFLLFWRLFAFYLPLLWECVYDRVRCTCAREYVWRPEDNHMESILSFYLCVGSGDRTWVIKLVQWAPLPSEWYCWPLHHLIICNRASHWMWSSLIWLEWLGIELRGSARLCLPSSGMAGVPCTWLSHRFWVSKLRSWCLHGRHFPNWAIASA